MYITLVRIWRQSSATPRRTPKSGDTRFGAWEPPSRARRPREKSRGPREKSRRRTQDTKGEKSEVAGERVPLVKCELFLAGKVEEVILPKTVIYLFQYAKYINQIKLNFCEAYSKDGWLRERMCFINMQFKSYCLQISGNMLRLCIGLPVRKFIVFNNV